MGDRPWSGAPTRTLEAVAANGTKSTADEIGPEKESFPELGTAGIPLFGKSSEWQDKAGYAWCHYQQHMGIDEHTPLLLLLLLPIRTQPHLGCCLAAATAAASAIFMHLCTTTATPYTSRQHMRSCNDVNGTCANRRSRLTTAGAGHEKRRWASSSTGRSCISKAAHRLQPNQTTP
jgi:hypothetical protein